MRTRKLAVFAHKSKMEALADLIHAHSDIAAGLELTGAREIAVYIYEKTKIPVKILPGSSLSSGRQFELLMNAREIDALIFLVDPANGREPQSDVNIVTTACDNMDIPLATNISTAEAVLHLLSEHPEALSGHHIAAQYLEDLSDVRN
jgi:methylglyoxal synthase